MLNRFFNWLCDKLTPAESKDEFWRGYRFAHDSYYRSSRPKLALEELWDLRGAEDADFYRGVRYFVHCIEED